MSDELVPTGIELEVCRDIARRQAVGLSKYGQTVADNPLPLQSWLQHAYEECLDQAVYLKRAMRELETTRTPDAEQRGVDATSGFRLVCDICGSLFNDYHEGESCPGRLYSYCTGTLQFNPKYKPTPEGGGK